MPPPPVAGGAVTAGVCVTVGAAVTAGVTVALGDNVALGDTVAVRVTLADGVTVAPLGLPALGLPPPDGGGAEPLAEGRNVVADAKGEEDPVQPETAAEPRTITVP